MMVALTYTNAPTPANATGANNRDRTGAEAAPDGFALLLAESQSGVGRQIVVVAATLHHQDRPFALGRPDAHQQRLEEMTEQVNGARNGTRSSRLADPSAEGLGPRAARLVLEKQDQAEQAGQGSKAATETAKPGATGSPTSKAPLSAQALEARSPVPTGSVANDAATGQPITEMNPNGQTERGVSQTQTDGGVSRSVEQMPRPTPNLQPPPVAASEGPTEVRASGRSETAATQIARLLSVRQGGALSPRAVTGLEQATAARGATGSTQSGQSTGRPARGTGSSAQTPASQETRGPESARRSDFDQLVRSVRLYAGSTRSTARILLHPPELGRIHIEAKMDGQRLELLVRTENDAAGELLRTRVAQLRTALAQHGLSIERFEVTSVGPSQNHSPFGGDPTAGGDDQNQPAPGGNAQGDPSGEGGEAAASLEQVGNPGEEPDGFGEEQSTVGDGSVSAATVAAGEPRLDIRV